MRNQFVSTALESINFQSDAFLKALAINVIEVTDADKKTRADSPAISAMIKTIKDYTGLNASVILGDYAPSMEIPQMHKNNVLINSWRRNHMNSASAIAMVNNANSVVAGAVDRRTGRVSGVYSEVPINIYMPDSAFSAKYVPEETASVIMHECGHAVSFFDCFGETASTNQVLQGIARGMEDNDVQVRIAVLETAKKKFNLKDFDVEKLTNCDSRTVQAIFVSNVTEQTRSQLGRNVYDLSSFEYLSDQFVARHGGSRHLATALAKLYKESGNIAFRNVASYLTIEIVKIALFLYLPFLSVLLLALDSQGNGEYDQPGARLKRIRNQVIENLKDKKLTKTQVEDLELDIKAIDEILSQANDRRQLLGILIDFFWIPARKDREFTKLQKDLENIAANELFAKSAQWRTMA